MDITLLGVNKKKGPVTPRRDPQPTKLIFRWKELEILHCWELRNKGPRNNQRIHNKRADSRIKRAMKDYTIRNSETTGPLHPRDPQPTKLI